MNVKKKENSISLSNCLRESFSMYCMETWVHHVNIFPRKNTHIILRPNTITKNSIWYFRCIGIPYTVFGIWHDNCKPFYETVVKLEPDLKLIAANAKQQISVMQKHICIWWINIHIDYSQKNKTFAFFFLETMRMVN